MIDPLSSLLAREGGDAVEQATKRARRRRRKEEHHVREEKEEEEGEGRAGSPREEKEEAKCGRKRRGRGATTYRFCALERTGGAPLSFPSEPREYFRDRLTKSCAVAFEKEREEMRAKIRCICMRREGFRADLSLRPKR